MPTSQPQIPRVPKTPLRIFVRDPDAPLGAFFVEPPGLAGSAEMRDIADEEITALAHLIYNAYREWKQQSPTSESPASAK